MIEIINANKKTSGDVFEIPVTWQVADTVKVQADSLEDAFNFVKEHIDDIPCGDNGEYVDGSYEVNADSFEETLVYQNKDALVTQHFYCEEDLSPYTTSMLFNSETCIAKGVFSKGKKKFAVTLDVCGEVNVTFKGETYKRPEDFPEELKERIKAHPYSFDIYAPSGEGNDEEEGDIYVGNNNWFEYLIPETGDGEVYEKDLSKATPQDILEDMKNIAEQYFISIEDKYWDVHMTVEDDCKTGYSIFLKLPYDSTAKTAIEHVKKNKLYESIEDLDHIDYVGRISKADFSLAVSGGEEKKENLKPDALFDIILLQDHVYIGMEDVAITYRTLLNKQRLSFSEISKLTKEAKNSWDNDETVKREVQAKKEGKSSYYPSSHKAACYAVIAKPGVLENYYLTNYRDISRASNDGATVISFRETTDIINQLLNSLK